MRKKGQTATEYLIILAVVIIIALIVVGVMGGIPGIGGGAGARTSQAYWSTADIAITSYSVTSAGAVTLNLRNNKPGSVTITSLTLDGGADLVTTDTTLTSGETTTVSAGDGTVNCSGSYSFAVSIGYTDVDTGASYTFDGDGQTLDGTCAT